jgi:hypothetical protein
MGILDASHGLIKKDENLYNPIYDKYNYESVNESYLKTGIFNKITKEKSYYQITDFGKAFIIACNDL